MEGCPLNVDQITPRVFVGSCPRSPEDAQRLHEEHGVTAILNLQTDGDLQYCGVDWDSLSACYAERGMVVRRVPIQDFNPEDLRRVLPDAVDALGQLVRDGQTVFVHCNAGVNRSPTTVIAYLYWAEGWDLLQADRHVQAQHVCEPYPQAIVLATQDRLRTV